MKNKGKKFTLSPNPIIVKYKREVFKKNEQRIKKKEYDKK